MPAIELFRKALQDQHIDQETISKIFAGDQSISDRSDKKQKAAFFTQAVQCMDEVLDAVTCHDIRDACACSKGGYRLKAVQKLAQEYAGCSLAEKVAALNQVTHMGKPALNPDGSITAGIGEKGGFECPCPVFNGSGVQEPVSLTYCYCCAGHFRFHYQIALGVKLETKAVLSSALNSLRTEPCRFVYEVVDEMPAG